MHTQFFPKRRFDLPLSGFFSNWLSNLWNRGLPEQRRVILRVGWPLYLLPWLLLMQVISPSTIWVALIVSLGAFYAAAYVWARTLAQSVQLTRQRQGTLLVAGDSLREDFTLRNDGPLPVLWAEFKDSSYLPGYAPSEVVSCGVQSDYRWWSTAVCKQRGVYRLGPHRLLTGDPFGLFRVMIEDDQTEVVLVYPRVAYLPPLELPRGLATGRDRRRRPLGGSERSAMVREYQAGDNLRYVHWLTTAHRGALMVSELELEPSGDLWIVLDLNQAVHYGTGEESTLEYSIVLAASLAAELLSGGQRRAVGLLTVGPQQNIAASEEQTILVPPQPGQGQIWRILSALAPVQAGSTSLGTMLHNSREALGKGHTVVVITAAGQPAGLAADTGWVAELLHLQRLGLASSVLFVTPANGQSPAEIDEGDETLGLRSLLAGLEIPAQFLQAGTPLRPALTYRRRRTVVRTTPTGGVVTYEVEEEVG